MFKWTLVLTILQITFIYLFAWEQHVAFGTVLFPFSVIMLILSIMFTFGKHGFDVKRERIRGFGVLFLKDKPTTNTGPHKLSLVNSLFLSSCSVMLIAIFASFV